METSDSECFESADEDFQSDEEDIKTIRSVKKCDAKTKLKDDVLVEKLHNLKLQPSHGIESLAANDLACGDTQKESENKKTESVSQTFGTDEGDTRPPRINAKTKRVSKSARLQKNTPKECEVNEDNVHKEELKPPEIIPECTSSEVTSKDKKSQQNKVPEESEQLHKQTSEESKPEAIVDENLWDDTEINWGDEAEFETVHEKAKNLESSATPHTDVPKKEVEEENMWGEDEDWEPVEQNQSQARAQEDTSSAWGNWGTWGVSSILNTATQSVSTLTQGISTVLESGIGVPDPEEMARLNRTEKAKLQELDPTSDHQATGFGLGNFVMGVSHLTKLVETTGTKVISGGLDTLETIGKKTMEVLQEGDPGLKKKRAFLKIEQDRPVLSQVLREAKEKSEHENKILEQKHYQRRAKNYETLFDDHQGLVHLEALEMLSKQCDIKLQHMLESLVDDALVDMQETMDQVKELCELPDEDDEDQASDIAETKEKLEAAVVEINVPITYKKLTETWDETETWLNNLKLDVCDERELHQQAIETLAQLTAIAVEQFHKTGELLLVKERRSTADEADSLVQLTTTLVSLIGTVAAKFSDKLNAKSSNSKNKEEINGLITNVFFEAANSSSYIQDAFQLLIPVLQVGAL